MIIDLSIDEDKEKLHPDIVGYKDSLKEEKNAIKKKCFKENEI